METISRIESSGITDTWEQITADLNNGGHLGNYQVNIQQGNRAIKLETESSPGGGMEGGFEVTNIAAALRDDESFRFSMSPQDLFSEIAKFFGAEDVITGFPEFDDKVMIKSNDAERLIGIVSHAPIRELLQVLSGYSLALKEGDGKVMLELNIQRAIIHPAELMRVYSMFCDILDRIDHKN